MKKFKLVCLMVSLVLIMQTAVFAADVKTDEVVGETIQSEAIQPRGRYLLGGGCTITPYYNYVMVSGHTDAYEDVAEITVKIIVLQEKSAGFWVEVWSDSITDYNTDYVGYPRSRVDVTPGYNYKVEGTHTVKHNGKTETCYSNS